MSQSERRPQRLRLKDRELVRRLWGYLTRHRKLLVAAVLLYPLVSLGVVVPPYLVRQIIDVAIAKHDTHALLLYSSLYALALALEFASGFFSQFLMSMLGQRAMRDLRNDLFAHVQRLSASYFDRTPLGRIQTRLVNDVEALAEVFATGAVTVFSDLVTIVAVFGMMFWLDWRLTLLALLCVPLLALFTAIFQPLARRAFTAVRLHLSRLNGFLAEHINGIEVVQAFVQEERTIQEFGVDNNAYRDANHRAIYLDSLLYSCVEAIGTVLIALIIWVGSTDKGSAVFMTGTIVAFAQYVRRVFVPIRDLSSKYTMLQAALAASERVFALLDEKVEISSTADAPKINNIERALSLANVSFAYVAHDEKQHWVLHDIDLQIDKGQHIALVGPTGSGKTSILRLLNRLYEPQKGQILIDGANVNQFDLMSLRQLFAVVLQDVHLFDGTVMDNLKVRPGLSDATVLHATNALGVHAMIENFPRGYQTRVQAGGSHFSAGQRQLLALARALVIDPPVLVLDEATSNIDVHTEALLQKAFEVILRGRTSLIVAHRLSTVRKVDRIVVLDQGRVVAQGSHAELMQRAGLYQDLVKSHYMD